MKTMDFTDLIELMEKSILKMKEVSEPKRWRAEIGGRYWNATEYFDPIETNDENFYCDNARYKVGNYFQTEAECQEFCDKVKSLLR